MKRPSSQSIREGWQLLKSDIRSARWAILAFAAYFVVFKRILYSMCPAVWLTGYPCPGCGMTRAAFRVLHLDFGGAWEIHPFIYPIGFLAAAFVWNRYVLGRREIGFLKKYAVLIAVGMLAFYLLRMAVFFPGEPPMSYYSGNLLARLGRLLAALHF